MRPSIPTAALLMALCTLLIAGTTLIAKALGTGALGQAIHPLMVSQARFVFGAAAVALVLGARRASGRVAWAPGPPPRWGLHALRTALGLTGGALMFTAAVRIPLADASALSFAAPVFTMLFSIPFLSERPGPWRFGAAALAMVGAAILLRPGGGMIDPAALLALGAAVAMGIEGIVIKHLAVTEPAGRTMLINNTMGAVMASVIAAPVWVMPASGLVWLALVAMGVVMVTAQTFNLSANRMADASFLAPFFYLVLVWAAVYDIAAFGVWPDATSLAGAAIIVASGLVMTWRELRRRAG